MIQLKTEEETCMTQLQFGREWLLYCHSLLVKGRSVLELV